MNVFFLDRYPWLAATYHCDKHVVKMIVETAQLLSTAHHLNGTRLRPEELYRQTHASHPCAVWVRSSPESYVWAHALLHGLLEEWSKRYGNAINTHATYAKYLTLAETPTRFPQNGWIEPPQCMPDQYKGDDPVRAYRAYYRGEKARFAVWRNGEPSWWKETT